MPERFDEEAEGPHITGITSKYGIRYSAGNFGNFAHLLIPFAVFRLISREAIDRTVYPKFFPGNKPQSVLQTNLFYMIQFSKDTDISQIQLFVNEIENHAAN